MPSPAVAEVVLLYEGYRGNHVAEILSNRFYVDRVLKLYYILSLSLPQMLRNLNTLCKWKQVREWGGHGGEGEK